MANELVATKGRSAGSYWGASRRARGIGGVEGVQAVQVVRAKLKCLHASLDQAQETASKNDTPAAKPNAEPETSFDRMLYLELSVQELKCLKTASPEDESGRQGEPGVTLKSIDSLTT